MSFARSPRVFTILAAAVATVGILAVYYGQIDTGLYYDDYHFVRPFRPLDGRRVWFGSWDPTGIESPFFRPLTAWLFALRFWMFGLNTQAMHVISVTGHVICAVMVSWFLRREGLRPGVALLASWVYAIYPVFPHAQVSWITNQMHLTVSVLVLVSLLIWQSIRDRPLRWWTVLLPTCVAAFLVKEDALMLLPVLVVLTSARVWLLRPAGQKLSWVLIACSMLVVTALIGFRQHRFGRLGGYGLPGIDQASANFWKGLDGALLLWPTRTPWQGVACVIPISAVLIALTIWRRRVNGLLLAAGVTVVALSSIKLPSLFLPISYPLITSQGLASGMVLSALMLGLGVAIAVERRVALFILCTGLVLAIGFDLPFALVSKREQYHLLGLGAVVMLTGVCDAFAAATSKRRLAVAIAILATVPLAVLARAQAATFLPCADTVLQVEEEPSHWWIVPTELKMWLERKRQICNEGGSPPSVADLPRVSWGLYVPERGPGGETYRWTSDHVVLLVGREASSLALAFRIPSASVTSPVTVEVRGSAQPITVRLESGEWQYLTVRWTSSLLTAMRAAHRLDIDVRPWFVPAVLDPKSTDLRRRGVQMRLIDLPRH
jgi:hypothetical protein